MMAAYALRTRRYMEEYGVPIEALGEVAVKAHENAALNPYAHYNKLFTLDQVLESRAIADPLTLYQCCPTSEGGSAAILCAKRSSSPVTLPDNSRAISVAGAVLNTGTYTGRGADNPAMNPYRGEEGARQAYEMAGIGPEDVDIVQVHDAATIGELQQLETLELLPKGEAWIASREGRTQLSGDLPTNTDGGLLGHGSPLRRNRASARFTRRCCSCAEKQASVRSPTPRWA